MIRGRSLEWLVFVLLMLWVNVAFGAPVEVTGDLMINDDPDVGISGIIFATGRKQTDACNGTITGVTGTQGITGSGTSGNVTLGINASVIQSRVSGSCPAGQSIRAIDVTGTAVTCQAAGAGTVASVGASNGLVASPTNPFTSSGTISIQTGGVTDAMLASGISGSKITGNISGNAASITGSISESQVTNLTTDLGGKVSKAGDTMSGNLTLPSLTMTGNLTLPATTASTGIIYSGSDTLIHTRGSNNFFAGRYAGNLTTTGGNNTAVGHQALYTQSFDGGTGWGSNNTAVGFQALYSNQPTSTNNGVFNTAVGSLSLYGNKTGQQNTALGIETLYSNTTGSYNTALGSQALSANQTGSENTAVGRGALLNNTTGSSNTAVGKDALVQNTAARYNTAVGTKALYTQSYSDNNTPWDSHNTAVGYQALYSNQPTFWNSGRDNTALGSRALYSNTTGSVNTALGSQALYSNITANHNTALGYETLYWNTTGDYNTALGSFALVKNGSGNYNTAGGGDALYYNNGHENVAFGYDALFSNEVGNWNAAFGTYALYNSRGHGNTALGQNAGYYNRDPGVAFTGNSNIYIGQDVSPGAPNESGAIRIGNSYQTKTFIGGIYGADLIGSPVYVNSAGQLGTSTSSRRYKEGIQDMGDASSGLMQLRPVTFYYKSTSADGQHTLQYGLIAEEVAEVYPDLVMYDPATGKPQTVHYHLVNAMLLNEVQRQQKEISDLKKAVDVKDARIARLEKDNERIAKALEKLALQVATIEGSRKTVALK